MIYKTNSYERYNQAQELRAKTNSWPRFIFALFLLITGFSCTFIFNNGCFLLIALLVYPLMMYSVFTEGKAKSIERSAFQTFGNNEEEHF